jgi:hypothetical protein
MLRALSICTRGTPELVPHWVKFAVGTGERSVPGLASMTMRNVPPSPENICGVGPGTYGVGVTGQSQPL